MPACAGRSQAYSRGKLGESLCKQAAGFDLSDAKSPGIRYNSLHDPALKYFFQQPEKKKRLIEHGLITHDGNVLCTLREYKQYVHYIQSVQRNWEKHFLQEQKKLLKKFMLLKLKGKVPEDIAVKDVIDWLIRKGRRSFRNMYQKFIQPYDDLCYAELAWEVNNRVELEKLEKEVMRDLRLLHLLPKDVKKKIPNQLESPSQGLSETLFPVPVVSHESLAVDTMLNQNQSSPRAAHLESRRVIVSVEMSHEKASVTADQGKSLMNFSTGTDEVQNPTNEAEGLECRETTSDFSESESYRPPRSQNDPNSRSRLYGHLKTSSPICRAKHVPTDDIVGIRLSNESRISEPNSEQLNEKETRAVRETLLEIQRDIQSRPLTELRAVTLKRINDLLRATAPKEPTKAVTSSGTRDQTEADNIAGTTPKWKSSSNEPGRH